jgi:elongation factor 1-beta
MANLLVRVKVMPKEADTKPLQLLEDIKKRNPQIMVRDHKEEPIAFGLVALVADFMTDDESGAMETIENALRASPLVGEFDVLGASRVSANVRK